MLAVHVLVAGSHEVLQTLLAKRNQEASFINDSDYINREYAKEHHDHMNRPQNFLKHVDRDPEAVLDFYPAGTHYWMFDAIHMNIKLVGSRKHRSFYILQK